MCCDFSKVGEKYSKIRGHRITTDNGPLVYSPFEPGTWMGYHPPAVAFIHCSTETNPRLVKIYGKRDTIEQANGRNGHEPYKKISVSERLH